MKHFAPEPYLQPWTGDESGDRESLISQILEILMGATQSELGDALAYVQEHVRWRSYASASCWSDDLFTWPPLSTSIADRLFAPFEREEFFDKPDEVASDFELGPDEGPLAGADVIERMLKQTPAEVKEEIPFLELLGLE